MISEQIQLKTDQVTDLSEKLQQKQFQLINMKKQLETVHSEKMMLQRSLETCTQERDNFRLLQIVSRKPVFLKNLLNLYKLFSLSSFRKPLIK